MSKEDKEFTEHYVAEFSKKVSFDELPDAPPSGKFRLSLTGKIGAVVVAFWVFIAIFAQFWHLTMKMIFHFLTIIWSFSLQNLALSWELIEMTEMYFLD